LSFKLSVIFSGSSVNWHEPKIEPPLCSKFSLPKSAKRSVLSLNSIALTYFLMPRSSQVDLLTQPDSGILTSRTCYFFNFNKIQII